MEMPYASPPAKTAFSLVELSIVLVILGLLVGGVLTGKALINAAAMRATMAQITDTQLQLNMFRDEYLALPGDMPNASSFWSTATNGNGNGLIETTRLQNTYDHPDNWAFNGERNQLYVQLGLAGFTPAYDGSATLGRGYPAIKLRPKQGMFISGAWTPAWGASNMNAELYAKDPLYLYMGICAPEYFGNDNYFNDCAIFTAEETYQIDTKIDDGKPLSGKLIAQSTNTICITGSNYNVATADPTCNILYSLR